MTGSHEAIRCSPTSMAVIERQLQTDADGAYADSVSRAEGPMSTPSEAETSSRVYRATSTGAHPHFPPYP